jgi:RIO kinase 1
MFTTLEGFLPIIQPFLDLELIVQLGEPIKSGKEATVFRCTPHPKTGHAELALKIYRPRARRSFKNDSIYREGSTVLRFGGGNTRAARALRAGTCFGRRVQGSSWCGREWEVLCQLHEAGLPVPAPVHVEEDAILMELFTCEDGAVAPQLSTARLDPSSASGLFHAICSDVADMLALHVLHGDLSPYNILWNGDAYRIIDFRRPSIRASTPTRSSFSRATSRTSPGSVRIPAIVSAGIGAS